MANAYYSNAYNATLGLVKTAAGWGGRAAALGLGGLGAYGAYSMANNRAGLLNAASGDNGTAGYGVLQGLGSGAQQLYGGIKDTASGAWDSLSGAAKDVWNGGDLGQNLNTLGTNVSDWASRAGEGISNWMADSPEAAGVAGGALALGGLGLASRMFRRKSKPVPAAPKGMSGAAKLGLGAAGALGAYGLYNHFFNNNNRQR